MPVVIQTNYREVGNGMECASGGGRERPGCRQARQLVPQAIRQRLAQQR